MPLSPEQAQALLNSHETIKMRLYHSGHSRSENMNVVRLDLHTEGNQVGYPHLFTIAKTGRDDGGETGFFKALHRMLDDKDRSLVMHHEVGFDKDGYVYLNAETLRKIAGIAEEKGMAV